MLRPPPPVANAHINNGESCSQRLFFSGSSAMPTECRSSASGPRRAPSLLRKTSSLSYKQLSYIAAVSGSSCLYAVLSRQPFFWTFSRDEWRCGTLHQEVATQSGERKVERSCDDCSNPRCPFACSLDRPRDDDRVGSSSSSSSDARTRTRQLQQELHMAHAHGMALCIACS